MAEAITVTTSPVTTAAITKTVLVEPSNFWERAYTAYIVVGKPDGGEVGAWG
eukprot:SAG22_NODE_608_length_8601_cov_24.764291_4_plen_52_part_00